MSAQMYPFLKLTGDTIAKIGNVPCGVSKWARAPQAFKFCLESESLSIYEIMENIICIYL
jgi:hypothetical protein